MLILFAEASALLFGAPVLARVVQPLGIPPLLGMMAAGLLLGHLAPFVSGTPVLQLDQISQEIRLAVLAVIILRAGLSLSFNDFRRAGPLALRLGTIPMLGDAAAVAGVGILAFDLRVTTAIILGLVVAAISPAIVIPGLLEIRERLAADPIAVRTTSALLAAAPVDNILAVVALGVAIDLAHGGSLSVSNIATSFVWTVAAGLAVGLGIGAGMGMALRRLVGPKLGLGGALFFWGCGCLLVVAGNLGSFSFVLALLALGAMVRTLTPERAVELNRGLTEIWRYAQYALFALIGAAVGLEPLAAVGLAAVALILCGQLGRAAGAWFSTTRLPGRQRAACLAAFVPKATIQAAFAGLALDRGLPDGELILSAGVLAIVMTAPVGVVLLQRVAPRLLATPATDRER